MANRGGNVKRILVVGGGLIGARHVQSVHGHDGCMLVGLVDPDPNVLTGADVPRYQDMSQVTGPVDGVILATPTRLHAAQGAFAASKGWHVLIEKPVASDLASAQALSKSVARAGVGSAAPVAAGLARGARVGEGDQRGPGGDRPPRARTLMRPLPQGVVGTS